MEKPIRAKYFEVDQLEIDDLKNRGDAFDKGFALAFPCAIACHRETVDQ